MMLLHALDGGPVTPTTLWQSWRAETVPVGLVVISSALYIIGAARLRSRAREHRVAGTAAPHAVGGWRVVSFALAMLLTLVALASPLDALADSLLVGHMLQHVLLLTVIPPLAVLAHPLVPLMFGLPGRARRALGIGWTHSAAGRTVGWLLRPMPALALHVVALGVWHIPSVYDAALRSDAVHALEHASFLLTAMMVWWVALRPHHSVPAAMFVLFGTFVASGALGATLTLAHRPFYYAQSAGAGAWGLTPLQDQQLGGLVMWVPGGLVYVGAMLAIFSTVLRARGPGDDEPAGYIRLA